MRKSNDWFNTLKKWSKRNRRLVEQYYIYLYSSKPIEANREQYIKQYETRNKEIIKYFDKNRLLVLNIGEGNEWESLCKFFNKKIPNTHFPHTNKTK